MAERTCSVYDCGRLVPPGRDLCSSHLIEDRFARRRRLAEIEAKAEGRKLCQYPNCTAYVDRRGDGRRCVRHLIAELPPEQQRMPPPPVGRYRKVSDGNGGTIAHHRLVVARHIGRPLLPHENVHHLNGRRDDNRLENLELWSVAQPAGQRIPDKVAFAIEILRQYKPEVLADGV